jgi:hypothetical protein
MTIPLHEMFIPRRFAVIALLLCLMEMVIFGLLIAIVHLSFGYSSGIQFVAAITYLICVSYLRARFFYFRNCRTYI